MNCSAVTAFLTLAFLAASPAAHAVRYLELVDFKLIDATGRAERQVQHLIARDGVIVQIDSEGRAPTPEPTASWTRIGLDGAWLMPGLIDTHVHVARFPNAYEMATKILQRSVRGGITGVRDLGGDARTLAEIERAGDNGEMIVPHLVFSAMLGGPDIFKQGPIAEMAAGRTPGQAPWAHEVTAKTDLRQLIAEARGSGATNAKVYGDLSPRLATRLIREARRQGLLTTAHSTVFPAGPADLIEAGIGTLAHAPYLVWAGVDHIPADYQKRTEGPWKEIAPDHPRLLALYRRMAERGVTLDATLYVYKAMQNYPGVPKMAWTESAFEWGARATHLAHEAGVLVTTGTDWFEPADDFDLPHTHQEMALLVESAGFTPMQAIIAATRNGAIAIGRGKTHGTVELGKVADFVVLDADPLDDIHNTSRIRFTIRNGHVVRPE